MEALQNGGALSARDVWERLGGRRPRPAFVTVYRALSALCDAGLARKRPGERGMLYESAAAAAVPQLVCDRCGKVEDVKDPALLAYNSNVMKSRSLAGKDALRLYAGCRRKECADGK